MHFLVSMQLIRGSGRIAKPLPLINIFQQLVGDLYAYHCDLRTAHEMATDSRSSQVLGLSPMK